MTMTTDEALATLQNPAADPAALAQVAYLFPAYRPLVAAHTQAYPELREWIAEAGDRMSGVVDAVSWADPHREQAASAQHTYELPLRNDPRLELADPETSAHRLYELAQTHVELWPLIVAHPNAYAGLRESIAAASAAQDAGAPQTMATSYGGGSSESPVGRVLAGVLLAFVGAFLTFLAADSLRGNPELYTPGAPLFPALTYWAIGLPWRPVFGIELFLGPMGLLAGWITARGLRSAAWPLLSLTVLGLLSLLAPSALFGYVSVILLGIVLPAILAAVAESESSRAARSRPYPTASRF